MFFLFRFVWPLVRPILIAAVVGGVLLAVFGFDPIGLVQGYITDGVHALETWITCSLLGWSC